MVAMHHRWFCLQLNLLRRCPSLRCPIRRSSKGDGKTNPWGRKRGELSTFSDYQVMRLVQCLKCALGQTMIWFSTMLLLARLSGAATTDAAIFWGALVNSSAWNLLPEIPWFFSQTTQNAEHSRGSTDKWCGATTKSSCSIGVTKITEHRANTKDVCLF